MDDHDIEAFRRATTKHRSVSLVESLLANLHRVARHPCATSLGRPLAGNTVYVVGAGPGLNTNGHLLSEAQRRGVIMAVNTSAGAVARHGASIDILVSIESVNVANHLDGARYGSAVLTLDASPHTWERVEAAGVPASWVLSTSPHTQRVCDWLGVAPLDGGGAALTTAVALATEWGADRVVLLGVNLAYGESTAYADGSGWDGLNVERSEGGLVVTGREDRDAAHDAAGVPRVPRNRDRIRVPGWRGVDVDTGMEWLDQLRWLETHLPGDAIDATEDGAEKQGWVKKGLAAELDTERGTPHRRWLDAMRQGAGGAEALASVRAEILAECDRIDAIASAVLGGKVTRGALDALTEGGVLGELMAAPTIIGGQDEGLEPPEQIAGTYLAMRSGAARIREALG